MTREIKPSLRQKPIPIVMQFIFRCKICKKKATSYFVPVGGGFVLLCEPCFQTYNLFYKRQISKRKDEGAILEDEMDY